METLPGRNYFTLREMVSSLCFELQKSRRNNVFTEFFYPLKVFATEPFMAQKVPKILGVSPQWERTWRSRE